MKTSEQFDLASSAFKANPYPTFARLRASEPVYLLASSNGQNTWLVTRYSDAELILRDERFVKDRQHLTSRGQAHNAVAPASAADLMSMSMVDFDPPDHTRLRQLFAPFFAPRQMELLRTHIQEVADELLDAVVERGSMDLIDEFAWVLPLRIIAGILGVPAEDCPRLHAWTRLLADSIGDPVAFSRAGAALQDFYAYLQELLLHKRQAPAGDLISELLQVERESGHISERELVTMIFLLLTAGHDTADNLIGSGMFALLTHPQQMALLRSQPQFIKTAVEEFLRYRSPFLLTTMRWAGEDLEIAGQQIRRGDALFISLAAANRDEEIFASAETLDITRQENAHLAFGKGIHYCLGAPLARLEGQIAIGTILRRLPNLRLQCEPEALVWRPGWLVQGLSHLPVIF
ncbi:MAG TPA: cytochrome P450 [Ktedonobacteraceae bacterium]